MIDMEKEKLVTMGQATKYVPRRRGRKVHASTIIGWIRRGYRGTFLDGMRQPQGWVTSVQAIQRFLAAVAKKTLEGEARGHAEQRERELHFGRLHQEAEAKLRARGLLE